MIEFLIFIVSLLSGVLFGYWQNNNLWVSKSDDVTRKECRGVLYWVIRDGDIDKFDHVERWIERTNQND